MLRMTKEHVPLLDPTSKEHSIHASKHMTVRDWKFGLALPDADPDVVKLEITLGMASRRVLLMAAGTFLIWQVDMMMQKYPDVKQDAIQEAHAREARRAANYSEKASSSPHGKVGLPER
jgi:hypothetical protein